MPGFHPGPGNTGGPARGASVGANLLCSMRLLSRCGGNVGAGDAGCKIARPLLLDPLPLPGSLMLALPRGPASGSEKRRTGLATSTPHPLYRVLQATAFLRLDYSWPYLHPRRQLLRGTRSTGVQGPQPLALFSRLNRDFFPGKKPGLNPRPPPGRAGPLRPRAGAARRFPAFLGKIKKFEKRACILWKPVVI